MSVVIPVLDDAAALRRCLAAVAAQTIPPFEVIVVDNGSADDSVRVAVAANVRVLHEPVRGIAAAASRGYQEARGDVIVRVDSDTFLPAEWVARALPAFRDPRVVAVTGPGVFADLGPVARWFWQLAYMQAYFLLMGLALARPPLFGSNVAFTRAAWLRVADRVDRSDARLHDDVDLSLHLDPAWRVVFDRRLHAEVSSTPVRGGIAEFRERTSKAFHTLFRHGWTAVPTSRWVRRALTAVSPPPVPSSAVGIPSSAWSPSPAARLPAVPERRPSSLGGSGRLAGHHRTWRSRTTAEQHVEHPERKERPMARTTSEAEGQDEADATTQGGLDAPSQAEGDDPDNGGE